MRYDLGRFRRPMRRSTEGQLASLTSLGDGSTLSLDFTTGVLDPRITFTRSTNATFINSQGLVEWANANMYWNTAFEGLSGTNPSLTSSGWGYALSSGGNAVFNGDGTVTMTTTATDRRAIFRSSGFLGAGLRVVASADVTIHSGSLQASQVIVTGTPINAQHYVDGLIWNATHPNWNGGILPVGTQFNIAYVTDSNTSGTTSVYFGVGCTTAIAGSATFVNPRWTMWKGSATVPYYPNTSATNNSTADRYKGNDYQAPRFDYDPTTPQPRGLLIEGSATNLTKYSEALDQVSGVTQWYAVNMNTPTVPGGAPNSPYGTSTASWKLVATAGAGFHAWRNSVAFTAAAHTFSFWAKAAEYDRVVLADPGTGIGACTFVLTGNGTATVIAGGVTPTNPTITPYGNGWYRCSVTMVMTAATYGISVAGYPAATTPTAFGASYTADGTSGVYVTMFQTELGSGASSYIPTGASTATRNADTAIIAAGSAFTSWYTGGTQGTFYADWNGGVRAGTSTVRTVLSTDDVTTKHLHLQQTAAAGNLRVADFGAANTVTTSNTLTSGNRTKGAFSYNGSNVNLCLNGGTVATSSSIAFSVTPTWLVLGGTSTNGTSITDANVLLNNSIRAIKYWPTALPNAQLQSLTT